jgi:GT2 family glycosyltransferase
VSADRPLLSVLIVNFNSTPLLEECLVALEASSIADRLEIIVVDNASADFELEPMAATHPSVILLPQDRNTTYTGGNNLAFERATADLVLMLNPDTRVEPHALERAVAHMRDEPAMVGLSAYLIGPDGKLQRYYRQLPTLKDLPIMLFEPMFRGTRRGRRFLMLDEPFEGATLVTNPPGAFLLSRRSMLDGYLLDSEYFNFVSDLELCDRLSKAGRIAVFDDVRCHHRRAGAGVGTTEPNARLRLYHDYHWGLRRYFGQRVGRLGRLMLAIMLGTYWMVRIGVTASRNRSSALRAIWTAYLALAGHPPTY